MEARGGSTSEEAPLAFAERLHEAVKQISDSYDVRGLCMELPGRPQDLASRAKGDRLPT